MKLDNYPFQGWDYLELALAWNLYIPDVGSDIEDHKPIEWFLREVLKGYVRGDRRIIGKVSKDLRIFLSKLGDEDNVIGDEYPMWKGLSKVRSNYTLIRLSIPLIGYMWD